MPLLLPFLSFHPLGEGGHEDDGGVGGMFPRVFGDEFGDEFGDSLNLVINLVTNSVMNFVNH